MAGAQSPLSPALHPDRILLDQPGGTMVRLSHRPDAPPRRAQERPGPGSRHPRLDRQLERQPQAIRLDQDSRRDPGLTGKIYCPNFRRRTLVTADRPAGVDDLLEGGGLLRLRAPPPVVAGEHEPDAAGVSTPAIDVPVFTGPGANLVGAVLDRHPQAGSPVEL